MYIKSATYVGSFITLNQCPRSTKPEFAFVGRSNVGKSSLINFLCGKKSLAKVSVTPGKTKTINYFDINGKWFLVDLPGYGYAKTSKSNRAQWNEMIRTFITQRKTLFYVMMLVDGRIPPQKIDIDFINWMGSNKIPFCVVFTKADKPASPQIQSNMAAFKNKLSEYWEELPPVFITSSKKNVGREKLLQFIQSSIENS
jgi:GTP-binding protein